MWRRKSQSSPRPIRNSGWPMGISRISSWLAPRSISVTLMVQLHAAFAYGLVVHLLYRREVELRGERAKRARRINLPPRSGRVSCHAPALAVAERGLLFLILG